MENGLLAKEILFTTARSGGKGGQNVNKVETAVTAIWRPEDSSLFRDEEKALIIRKLTKKLNQRGEVLLKVQTSRSQLANKEEAVEKMWKLISDALVVKKPRIASKPSKAAKEKRLSEKKRKANIKQMRTKRSFDD